jgi:hypothetical protein
VRRVLCAKWGEVVAPTKDGPGNAGAIVMRKCQKGTRSARGAIFAVCEVARPTGCGGGGGLRLAGSGFSARKRDVRDRQAVMSVVSDLLCVPMQAVKNMVFDGSHEIVMFFDGWYLIFDGITCYISSRR